MGIKLTTQQFIERAQLAHGDRYNYSQSILEGAMKKIAITCPVHGVFHQVAMDHMKGRGCALCNERRQLTLDLFIRRANSKHDHKYQYNNVQYVNVNTKVDITCPIHGEFAQLPKDHLHGYGCPACAGTAKVTTEQFVLRAKQTHDDKYDYSSVRLSGMNTDVTIICPDHGPFQQRPADHVNGVGCPGCGALNQGGYTLRYFDKHPHMCSVPASVYLISVDDLYCKVGITRKEYMKHRFPGLRFTLICRHYTTMLDAFNKEQHILAKYAHNRRQIDTLKDSYLTGWTECFPLSLLPALKQDFERL